MSPQSSQIKMAGMYVGEQSDIEPIIVVKDLFRSIYAWRKSPAFALIRPVRGKSKQYS